MVTKPGLRPREDRQELILDAVLRLLADHGIAGVSIRSVAREAGVAHGLVGYYYDDKVGLIGAALRKISEQDDALLAPDPGLSPEGRLRAALRRVADDEFLTTEYLSLRLQLWSLARADAAFVQINSEAQKRYRKGLSDLIRAARPTSPDPSATAGPPTSTSCRTGSGSRPCWGRTGPRSPGPSRGARTSPCPDTWH